MSRAESREIASKILYQIYIYENANIDYDTDKVIDENVNIKNDFINDLVLGVLKNSERINNLANKYLDGWTIDRLSKVDKGILSIGIYELIYTDTPPIVAINECIELSKKYSDEKVTDMINATLDKIYHEEEER